MREALELLKKAHEILDESDVENLKKSATYLKQSIECLARQKQTKRPETQ